MHNEPVVEDSEASKSSLESCDTGSKKDCAGDLGKMGEPDKAGEQATDSLSLTNKLVDLEFDVDSHPHSLPSIQQVPEPEFLQPLSQDFECPL